LGYKMKQKGYVFSIGIALLLIVAFVMAIALIMSQSVLREGNYDEIAVRKLVGAARNAKVLDELGVGLSNATDEMASAGFPFNIRSEIVSYGGSDKYYMMFETSSIQLSTEFDNP